MTTRAEVRNAPVVEPNAAYWQAEYYRLNVEIDRDMRNLGQAKRLGEKASASYWRGRMRDDRVIRQYAVGNWHRAELAEARQSGLPIHIKSDKRNAFVTVCGQSTIDPDVYLVAESRPALTDDNRAEYCADCVRIWLATIFD